MHAKEELKEHVERCMEVWGYSKYDASALVYAEHYGIVEFHVKGNQMIYYPTFPEEHATYRAVVNLDTFSEKREKLKKYYKAYKGLIGGRYQATWDY